MYVSTHSTNQRKKVLWMREKIWYIKGERGEESGWRKQITVCLSSFPHQLIAFLYLLIIHYDFFNLSPPSNNRFFSLFWIEQREKRKYKISFHETHFHTQREQGKRVSKNLLVGLEVPQSKLLPLFSLSSSSSFFSSLFLRISSL